MAEILAARSASFMQVLGAFKQGNKNTSSEGGAAGAFLGVLRAQLSASVAEGSAVEGAEGSIFGLTSGIKPLDNTLASKATNEIKSGLIRDIARDIAGDVAGEISGEKLSVAGGAGLTSGEANGEAANALAEIAAPHRSSPSLASASGVEAEFETQFEAQFGAKLADKLDAQQAVGLATSQSPYQSAALSALEIAPTLASASALEVTSDTSALSKQPWVKVDQLPPRQGETTSNAAIDTSLKHSLFIHELVDKKATDSVGNVAANFTETRQNLPPLTIEKELETKLSEPLATGLNKKVNKLLENEAAEERLTPPLTAQINTPPIGVQFGDRFEGRLENQLGTQRVETESTLAASKPDVVLATRSSSWSAQAGELETSSTRSTATVVEAAFALQQDNKFSAIVDQPTKTLASKAVSEIKNESINEMFGKKSGAEIGAEVVSEIGAEIVSEIVSKVDPEADAVMRTAATITAASSPVATAAELRQDSQSFTPAVLKMVPAAALAAKEITGSEGNAAANLSEARQDRLSFANAVGAERSLPPLTTQINTPPTEGQLSAQRTRTATQADAVLLKDVPSLSGQESELEANSTLITGSTFEAASKSANAQKKQE